MMKKNSERNAAIRFMKKLFILMNVNLQMNYWPAYSTNLSECADPLIRYVDSLRRCV